MPGQDLANRREEIRDKAILDHEPDFAKGQRPVDELAIAKVGDQHDLRRRAAVLEPADGRALIKAAAELKPALVVVDIGMPLLNGLDAADQVKAFHPDIKVIFLTQKS